MPTLTQKGQVTIPKNVREALGLDQGDEVIFEVDKQRAILRKKDRKPQFQKYLGFLKHLDGRQVDNIIKEMRETGE